MSLKSSIIENFKFKEHFSFEDYYVYGLFNSSGLYYIGKGSKGRIISSLKCNKEKNIVRKTSNFTIPIRLCWDLEETKALKIESKLINDYISVGLLNKRTYNDRPEIKNTKKYKKAISRIENFDKMLNKFNNEKRYDSSINIHPICQACYYFEVEEVNKIYSNYYHKFKEMYQYGYIDEPKVDEQKHYRYKIKEE